MRLRSLAKFCVTGLSVLILTACGGSGSSSDSGSGSGTDPVAPVTGNTISVFGSDGPMAGADVAVYDLQAYLDDSDTAENLLAAAAKTDAVTALADDLELSLDAGMGPFLVVVTANDDTIDLSTGVAPVISEVSTIAVSLTDARVYATPLTTMAVALAMDGETVADNVIGFKLVASQSAVKAFVGFGMDRDIDIFTVPPVLDENTTSADVQADVAQYRGANEALAFIIEDSALDLASIIVDASDGILNDDAVIAAIQDMDVLDVLARVSAASIADLLDADATGLADGYDIDAGVDEVAPSNVVDSDADGANNVDDDFDFDSSETTDTDSDGTGDNADNCQDVSNADQANFDNDAQGDVCDDDDDNDGVNDDVDAFDNDASLAADPDEDGVDSGNASGQTQDNCPNTDNVNQANFDNDAQGDVCDDDDDNDGVNDDVDAFDNDASLAADPDEDGVDSGNASGQTQDNCPNTDNASQTDTDNDDLGDACDPTPNGDDDLDNIDNLADNCPTAFNTDQADLDNDDTGNACDIDADGDGANGDGTGGPSATDSNDLDANITIDSDGDTVDDLTDNCVDAPNTDQADLDIDGDGNACDIDADGDGANGDGAGGPSVTDDNDLDANITIDSDGDTVDDLTDNCVDAPNTDQADLDIDGDGNACDIDADGDGANGDGAGGPSATDSNDLDDTISIDDDNDSVDDSIDNCVGTANNDQADIDNDDVGDACDSDIDGDTLANENDPAASSSESTYHFDFFYNQLSSDTEAFKVAVVGETVTQSDGTIDIGVPVDSTTLDLGSDETGNGSFDVRADYANTEESLSYTGTDFSTGASTFNDETVSDDNLANTVALSFGTLAFTDETPATALTAWGKYNFIGSGRVTLNGASTTLATAEEQAFSVLSFADGSSDAADLNADYGVVIMDTVYGDDGDSATIEELVNLFTTVGVFGFDGAGALTLADGRGYLSGLGTLDGEAAFSTALPAASGTYTVSPEGAVELVIGDPLDDEILFGFTDSEGDLMTFSDPASRTYGVKLGSAVTNMSLANKLFDLQGLVIDSSNVTLNASTYLGGVATFNADGTTLTLSGDITKAVAAFSDTALPSVTTATETLSLTSNAITIADNGRLSPITFADSGLELEGFYTANGLLLRWVDTFAETAGGSGGPSGPGLQVGADKFVPVTDITGGTPQVCDPAVTTSCSVIDAPACELDAAGVPTGGSAFCPYLFVLTETGDIFSGYWTISSGGPAGVSGSFTDLLRNNENVSQDFSAIDTDAGEDYEVYRVTQGVLFGTELQP